MSPRVQIMAVAHNFTCDEDTTHWGEAYHDFKKVERAWKLLRWRIHVAASRAEGKAEEFFQGLKAGLDDVQHDNDYASNLAEAEDAASEAMVRLIRRVIDEAVLR